MDPRLQEMLDHHDIRNMLCTYSHGCDRHDAERMASVYLDDSWDDHGPTKLPGKEFVKVIMGVMVEQITMISHHLGQSFINVTGDEAGAETQFICTMRRYEDDDEILDQMGGRYVDSLIRENGEWKIKKRVAVRDWSMMHRVNEDLYREAGFVEGKRTGADPSFEVLGLAHSHNPDLRDIEY